MRRLLKERGLHALQPKSYVPKTSDGRADKPSENLIDGKPMPERPNQVFAGDITHIPAANGWLYLAVVIDLCSRKVVGWALADNMKADLVIKALVAAIASSPARSRQAVQESVSRCADVAKHVSTSQSLSQCMHRIDDWDVEGGNAATRHLCERRGRSH